MSDGYYLILVGLIAVGWNLAAIAWSVRNPDRPMPPILMAGPGIVGMLAILQGLSRANIA